MLGRLLGDDFAGRDARRVGERRLELVLAHPVGGDMARLVCVLSCVEDADRRQDAVSSVDEVVTAEARELLEARDEGLIDLL